MNNIRTTVERLDENLIAKFSSISTPTLSDVMGRHFCMDSSIKPIYTKAKIVGSAFTVKTYPSDNLMCHIALKMAMPGDVLVIDAGGYTNAGLWGELMSIAAKLKGIAGVVIDGGARDCREIEEMGFPVFARGISARGGYKINPGSINNPVACGGISVGPGDIIVADENGVVAIPKEDANNVYDKALKKIKQEEEIKEKLLEGKELFSLLSLDSVVKQLNISTTMD